MSGNASPLHVWLDDVRPAPEGWTWVKTPEEVVAHLETGRVERLSLDHDLGLTEDRTGYAVLVWLEEAVVLRGFTAPASIAIHSANPVGRQRMQRAIEAIGRAVR
jgi:hypothetical protein